MTKANLTLAFTSCMSATAFPKSQPVWKQIASKNPDVLVLLGDSVYLDVSNSSMSAVKGYTNKKFVTHLLNLYQKQFAVPEFTELVKKTATYAIWDDHDFLWNDADGRERESPGNVHKTLISANLLRCWREALLRQKPLPNNINDARIWKNFNEVESRIDYDKVMPGYKCIAFLDKRVVLHLTDGRSWRGYEKGSLLGVAQRKAIQKELANAPKDAIHLLASGSTFWKHSTQQESWFYFDSDREWLLKMAAKYNILMLSGDVHKVQLADPIACGKKYFYEATASGAAVNFLPWKSVEKDTLGVYTEKYGLLNIDLDNGVEIQLFDHGVCSTAMQTKLPRIF